MSTTTPTPIATRRFGAGGRSTPVRGLAAGRRSRPSAVIATPRGWRRFPAAAIADTAITTAIVPTAIATAGLGIAHTFGPGASSRRRRLGTAIKAATTT